MRTLHPWKYLLLPAILGLAPILDAGPGARPLRILSYNVLHGMELDESPGKAAFVSWLKKLDPDVVGLQEAQKLTQKSLEEMARKYGHPYAVLLKEDGHPTALTSKYPIVNVRKVIDNLHHGFIQAEIEGYHVMVIHLSPHKYWKRREEMDLLLATVQSQPEGGKWVLMGDFNAVSPLDAAMYKNGKLVQARIAAQKKHAIHDNLVNGQLDFEVIQRILSAGFLDTVRLMNRDDDPVSQPTHRYITADGRNVPRRVDYIFVSENLRNKVLSSRIVADEFTGMHSDHYPVLVELR